MDTEYGARLVAELLALKDAPDDALLDQVQAISVTTARSILYDEAKRLRDTNRQAKMDCIALVDRINELIRIGPHDRHPPRDAPYRS
jgi:hypothetical protein